MLRKQRGFAFGLSVIASALMMAFSPVNAEAKPVVMVAKYNPVSHPKDIQDAISECHANDLCRGTASALAAAFGLPKQELITLDVTGHLMQNRRSRGEDHYTVLLPPAGYRVCRALMKMISINPPAGARSSHFSLQAVSDRVQIYSWVPRGSLGQGRRWIDATIYVTAVKARDYYRLLKQSVCNVETSQMKYFACRGSDRYHDGAHGYPACPSKAEVRHRCSSGQCPRF